MAWELTRTVSGERHYVRWDAGRREADELTDAELDLRLIPGAEALITPTGPMYPISGPDDETATFLVATNTLGMRLTAGTAPVIPPASPTPTPGIQADVDEVDGPGVDPATVRQEETGAQVPPSLVAGLYALVRQHADCDDYCLHGTAPGERKVHPGPCRGWKETLRKVAPGVHDIIEGERKRKLAEKRAAKLAEKPKPPPVVSEETRAAVAAAVAAIPNDEAGWHAVVGRRTGVSERRIDRRIREMEDKLPAARKAREEAVIKARAAVRKERWSAAARRRKRLTEEEEERAQSMAKWSFDLGGRDLTDLEASLELNRQERDAADAAQAAGNPLTANQAHHLEVLPPESIPGEYPRDANGNRMPPPELAEMERSVTDAGRALAADIDRAVREDPEVRRLEAQAERGLEMRRELSRNGGNAVEVFRESARLRRDAERGINRRRHEIALRALGELRPMGGQRHTNVTAGPDALPDWQDRMPPTDSHFPDDWVALSARHPLAITASDRAYYAGEGNRWETNPGGGTLSMNTAAHGQTEYLGGFADYVEEVNVHEMGHRMEQQVPGLQALEFAWVRRHTTRPDGTLEPLQRLADMRPNAGYDSWEVARPDRFTEQYTGRDYAGDGADPAAAPWEVFQVGLQESLGSSREFSGSSDLVPFTLGVLATLGRTS